MPGEKSLESLLKSGNEYGGTLVAMQPKWTRLAPVVRRKCYANESFEVGVKVKFPVPVLTC